jgi:hypothetical protein
MHAEDTTTGLCPIIGPGARIEIELRDPAPVPAGPLQGAVLAIGAQGVSVQGDDGGQYFVPWESVLWLRLLEPPPPHWYGWAWRSDRQRYVAEFWDPVLRTVVSEPE